MVQRFIYDVSGLILRSIVVNDDIVGGLSQRLEKCKTRIRDAYTRELATSTAAMDRRDARRERHDLLRPCVVHDLYKRNVHYKVKFDAAVWSLMYDRR